MRPTSDTSVSRPDLGQAAYEVMQDAPTMGYIGQEVMPYFNVSSYSATFPVIPKEELFNILDTRRASTGHYNRYGGEFEEGKYTTTEHGLERPIDQRFLAMYGSKFDYEMTITRIAQQDILRAREYRIAQKIMNATNFTANAAAGAWDVIGSVPKNDIDDGKESLRGNGIIPNALIISYATFLNLQLITDIKNQVYQLFPDAAKTGQISIKHLETYFDIERILVGGAVYNSSKRGQDASLATLWSDSYAMLAKVGMEGDDIAEPCIGRSFLWNEGAEEEVIVEQYWEDASRSEVLRVRHDVAEAFITSYDEDGTAKSEISKACGYLISSIVT